MVLLISPVSLAFGITFYHIDFITQAYTHLMLNRVILHDGNSSRRRVHVLTFHFLHLSRSNRIYRDTVDGAGTLRSVDILSEIQWKNKGLSVRPLSRCSFWPQGHTPNRFQLQHSILQAF